MTRTVLITGTSSGYGQAMAALFLAQGWNVLATMRRPAASPFAPDDRLAVLPLDVTDASSISAAIEAGLARFGAIDAMVNNAGIGLASAFEATPDATIRDLFETNTFGVMACCRAIIPLMREQRRGVIVNVTSSVTIGPMPLVAAYAASKCAIEGFTESLAYELHPLGITARLVEPGYAPTTQFTANGMPRMEGLIPQAYGAFAAACFEKMGAYPTAYCTEDQVAEATLAAATEEGRRLRYPAGADTEMLAAWRWSSSEEVYQARMRAAFEPG